MKDADHFVGDISQMKKEQALEKEISIGAFKSRSLPKNQKLKVKVLTPKFL